MELTYTKVGDYYIPDLALDDGSEYEIGVYGRMREKFLKERHPGVYNQINFVKGVLEKIELSPKGEWF